jgi:protein PhnA
MSKGYEKHNHRSSQLNIFGKALVRRAKGSCELCGTHHSRFQIYEVEPVPEQPRFEHCIHICEPCYQQISKPKLIEPNHWHGLTHAVWSEIPAIQVTAILMLRRIKHEEWAQTLLEQLYISDEVNSWLSSLHKNDFK